MRLLPLCWLLGVAPVLAAPVQLKLLEWGYLPAGYEQQFTDYAKAHGVEATVSRVEPLLTDFDSAQEGPDFGIITQTQSLTQVDY